MTVTKSATVTAGTSPTWQVSATGFVTQSGTVADIAENTTLPIYLLGTMEGVKKVDDFSSLVTWYLTESGDLYGCGYNSAGQQGSGDTNNVTTFTKRAENVKDFVGTNYTAWYITNDGDLYGCGESSSGQQGNGGTSNVTTFTKRAENVKLVKAGSNVTWYLTESGDLYGCGNNANGQQGAGNTTNVTTFIKRAENVKDFGLEIASDNSANSTWYLTVAGDLYICGNGYYGQQGSGSSGSNGKVTTFTKRGSNVKVVKMVNDKTWYITNDGELYGCGRGFHGEQGSGNNTNNVTTFTKRASGVKDVISGYYTTWYLTESGDLYGCGSNEYGQQGKGSSGADVTTFTKRASGVKDIITGYNATWYITNDGELYGCGAGERGQQGNGGTSNVTTFTKRAENVKLVLSVLSFNNYVTWYITNDGDLYGCGQNYYGQQGSGSSGSDSYVTTFTKRGSNVKVVSYNTRSDGSTTWYLTESGDLYGCGSGGYGQQGSGDTNNVTTFTRRYEGSINTANLTITPTPASATVTINGSTTSSADIRKGMPATWEVAASGYVTQTGTIDHIYDDTTLTVDLESE